MDLEAIRSSQLHHSSAENTEEHPFHLLSVSVEDLKQWKDKKYLLDTEYTAVLSLLKKVLQIKEESLSLKDDKQDDDDDLSTITSTSSSYQDAPSTTRRIRSCSMNHKFYDWTQEGTDKRKTKKETSCCFFPATEKSSKSTEITKFFFGFGPSIPSPLVTKWRNTKAIMRNQSGNIIYKTIIWLGRTTGGMLATYGITFVIIIVSIIVGLYSEYECIESLRVYDNGTFQPFATLSQKHQEETFIQRLCVILLVSMSQLFGGGTAPGTVHSGTFMCSFLSMSISILNIALRSLFFAIGLNLMTEVEPEMMFSSKLTICMRNGTPTLLCRFGLVGSDCAVIESVTCQVTHFTKSLEGHSMTTSHKLNMSCFPICSSPILASHAITTSSAFKRFVDVLSDGTCKENIHSWKPHNIITVNVVCYDTILERTVRRVRVYLFDDILIGHRFGDVMKRGLVRSMHTLQPPVHDMEHMHETVVQDIFMKSYKKQKENEEDRNNQIYILDDENNNKNSKEEKNNGNNDGNSEDKVQKKIHGLAFIERDESIEEINKLTLDTKRTTLREIELWHFENGNLTKFERIFLIGVLKKCFHLQNDASSSECSNEFSSYLRNKFKEECIESKKKQLEWKSKYHSYLKKCHCQRTIALCWSGRCFENRQHENMSDVATAIMNGEFPEFIFRTKNKNSGLQFDLMYQVTRCIHYGDLRIVTLSFLIFFVLLAVLLGGAYGSAQCFDVSYNGENNMTYTSRINMSNRSTSGHNFGQAFTSTFIQLATGVPSDPIKHDHPVCAFFILICAVSNIIIRVLVFSVGLHALETSKPSIIFSKKIILKIRNGQPVFQFRAVAPTAHTLQILNCKMYFTYMEKTTEGEMHAQVDQLPIIFPSNLFCPIFMTHRLDTKSLLKNHWLQYNSIPRGFILMQLGLCK